MNQEPNNQGVTAPTRNGVPSATLTSVPAAPATRPATSGVSTTPSPTLASSSGGASADSSRARDLLQPIEAQFFNVARNDGTPIAGLIVLVDSKHNPVRAELHLHEGISDESGRQAVRQAQHIIEDRYSGPEAIPMQVWQSFLRSDHPLPVQLNPEPTKSKAKSSISAPTLPSMQAVPWKPVGIFVGALAIVALIWGLWSWLGPDNSTTGPESGGLVAPVGEAAGLEGQQLTAVEESALTTGDLPVSVNANANISLGKRVEMLTGLSQPVRSQPGANAGEAIGTLEAGNEVLIVGGPTLLPGQSDTIVWWEIQFSADQTGWVAANNSSRPLLQPLE